MDVKDAIIERRSIRAFLDKPIPEDAVDILIDAIRWAPSAGNLQARKFFFVFKNELKQMIAEASLRQMFISAAPLVIVACGDYDRIRPYGARGKDLYVIQDVAIAVENLMLQAHELGLGSVCVGAFNEELVSALLNLPENLRPFNVIPVGYPARRPTAPKRLPNEVIAEIIR